MRTRTTKALGLTVLAIVLVAASLPAAAQEKSPFLGDWKGKLSVAGQDLEIVLHFTLDANKALAGTIDIPAQNATGLPLGNLKAEGQAITFVIAGVPGDPLFKGALDASGKKIAGSFTQAGYEGTFAVDKI